MKFYNVIFCIFIICYDYKDCYSREDGICLISELEIMKNIGQHDNIIKLFGLCKLNGPVSIVMEYAENGNLRDFLRNCKIARNTFDSKQTYEYTIGFATQITRGMLHIESKQVLQ